MPHTLHMTQPQPYEPPTISVVGDVQALTAGTPGTKGKTDKTYPARTKVADMGFTPIS
jgi:hypothetical protein